MHKVYRLDSGIEKVRSTASQLGNKMILAVATLVTTFGLALMPIASAHNNGTVVYDNTPNPLPGNVASIGYEATSTAEFGSQVQLAGTARNNPSVDVVVSSWACKSGSWDKNNCITNRGSTFTHPVTLNLYEVGPGNTVGDQVASETQTFTMPYRPTADDGTHCSGANAGKWWDGSSCNNGKAFTITFDFTSVTLPDKVIAAVAYNTSDYGVQPLRAACQSTPQGCPYDALNVGTNPAPTVGKSLPSNNDAYLSSTWSGAYCDNGAGGTGTLRLDAGCWTGYLPAIQISASKGNKQHNPGHGHGSWWNHSGQKDDNKHKNDSGRNGWDKHSSFFSLKQD